MREGAGPRAWEDASACGAPRGGGVGGEPRGGGAAQCRGGSRSVDRRRKSPAPRLFSFAGTGLGGACLGNPWVPLPEPLSHTKALLD